MFLYITLLTFLKDGNLISFLTKKTHANVNSRYQS